MREALFLAHRIPYPPDKGDKIRSYHLLLYLAGRFRVHLAAFVDDPDDFRHRDRLARLCASATLVPIDRRIAAARSALGFVRDDALTFSYFRDRRMQRAVETIRVRPLAAEVAFSSSMAPYIQSKRDNRPRIVDLCDADSLKWADYSRSHGWPLSRIYAREAEKLMLAETRIINWADASFAVSENEARLLASRESVKSHVNWFGIGVDTAYFDPTAISCPQATADVVFVGAMDYRANDDAVLWFVRDIWTRIRAAHPGATFAVVGRNPSSAIRRLAGRNGVIVTGRVDDVRFWLAGAKISVAPMRIARGVQNKLLEAMAMALPVVGTPACLAAAGIRAGVEAVAADSPAAFAEEVSHLLCDELARGKIGTAARARILADFQWPAQLARFGKILNQLDL